MRSRTLGLASLFLYAATLASAQPLPFHALSKGQSRATFKTDAPLETIVGNTSIVTGSVSLDRANPAGAKGSVEVDLASLRTGIDMRDEHLRSPQWLDTAKYPKATFELEKLDLQGPLAPTKPVKGKASGKLTIHGVTREVQADVTATYFPLTAAMRNPDFGLTGDIVKVDASFTTSFSDHGLQVPQMLFYKVSNDIQVQVSLTLVGPETAPATQPAR